MSSLGGDPPVQTATVSRRAIASPSSSRSAERTAALTGTTEPPSFGQSDVDQTVAPIAASTGTMPQPELTGSDASAKRSQSLPGTVTLWNGDGPRQDHGSPVKVIFIAPR